MTAVREWLKFGVQVYYLCDACANTSGTYPVNKPSFANLLALGTVVHVDGFVRVVGRVQEAEHISDIVLYEHFRVDVSTL
jgi:hypothetical protein